MVKMDANVNRLIVTPERIDVSWGLWLSGNDGVAENLACKIQKS